MALQTPVAPPSEPRPRLWTVDEYHALAEMGWFEGERVELIGGTIIQMSPQKELHFQTILLISDALRAAFGPGHSIRPQGPLTLGGVSEAEPDVAVVRGTARDYAEHPTTALLVVEVSESSLAYDRGEKASLYAWAGIADYWILNLVDRQLEIRRDPVPDADEPHGFTYSDLRILHAPDSVAPLAAPGAMILVRDLLP